jgi:hypothetical protein
MYTTSLLASEEAKGSPRDVWGWPKVPLLRTLSPSSGSDAWRTASSGNGSITYSALIGLVLQGIPSDLDVEFPVESSYFGLDCHFVANNLTSNETLQRMGEHLLVDRNASILFGNSRGQTTATFLLMQATTSRAWERPDPQSTYYMAPETIHSGRLRFSTALSRQF